MKIISWNVNGIRAVYKKGFLDWLKKIGPDILCLQEVKAKIEQIPPEILNLPGYFTYFNPAKRPGYAGVAVFSKEKPIKVERGIGFKRFDEEGRVLKLTYPKFTLFNFYIPFGGRNKENLSYKLAMYQHFFNILSKKVGTGSDPVPTLVLVGDFNIAHQEIDLARPKENKNNIMFTPKEREQIDKLVEVGFCDTFRKFHKDGGHYTWWSNFAKARERNLGWRIDYCFTSPDLTKKLTDGFILPEVMGSDHCPAGVVIDEH